MTDGTNPVIERVAIIRAGLDLANVLASDIPITHSARRKIEDAYAALEAMPDEWQGRLQHALSCLDSCEESGGLPSELDPEDVAMLDESRAALAKVSGE